MEGNMNGRNLISLRHVLLVAVIPGLVLLSGCKGRAARSTAGLDRHASASLPAEEEAAQSPRDDRQPDFNGLTSLDDALKTSDPPREPTPGDGDQRAEFWNDHSSWVESSRTDTKWQDDAGFSLFGEVNGVGGNPDQSSATESITQVSFASEGRDFDPDIESTGQYMVYASTQHAVNPEIYMKRIDGRTVVQLTRDAAQDMMPTFSPDNSQIAFCSNRAGNWDIYIMDLSGNSAVQLTNDLAHEAHPTWSPDGQFIAYCRLGEQSGRWEIWCIDVQNPAVRRFLDYGLFPEWCPDPEQNKIVFQRARERGSRLFSIWTIDIVDGEALRPTEIASAANAAAINPSWSPDGRMITFATTINPETVTSTDLAWADVWVVNVDGSNRVRLTNGEYSNVQPTWGSDGRVYFVSNRSGMDNIWAIGPDRAITTALGPRSVAPGNDTGVATVPTSGN